MSALRLSKTQIDRLGDRLRDGAVDELDLRLLDEYRRSFDDSYRDVIGRIAESFDFEPTGRPAKSTVSIIRWAQMCEVLSDTVDPAIKYGGGPQEERIVLDGISRVIARLESEDPEGRNVKRDW